MDWTAVEKLGMPVFLTVAICAGSFWLIRTVISMFAQMIQKANENFTLLMKSHEGERDRWMAHYIKMDENINTAARFNREEHVKIMEKLERIEDK